MTGYFKATAKKLAAFLSTKERKYQDRVAAELHAFNTCTDLHNLPPIFHYWSNKYLAPNSISSALPIQNTFSFGI